MLSRFHTAGMAVAFLMAVAFAEEPRSAHEPQPFPAVPAISSDEVRPHVEYLAGPELRGRGDPQSKRLAAGYIQTHFERLGLKPLFAGEEFFQTIPGTANAEGRQILSGRNVGAWLPGTDPKLRDEFLIISAHYDHLGTRQGKMYPGADDNATGVALVLEIARRFALAKEKPRRSLVFLGFDLEEQMLWGSRWFVAHPPWPLQQVKLFITADMIGRSLGDLPLDTIYVMGGEHAEGLKQIVNDAGTPRGLEVAHLGIDLVGTRSDYGPFRAEKVPFLFFSSGEHPHYHTPEDTPQRVNYTKAARVASLVLNVCRQVAQADAVPVWTDTPRQDLDEVRALHRITSLLLAQDDADRAAEKPRRLSDVQRFLVSNVHVKAGQIIHRGEIKADERAWLIRSSQVLLLTVF